MVRHPGEATRRPLDAAVRRGLAGRAGIVIGIDRFGASAPEKALAEEYGFTPAQVAARVEAWLAG